MHGLEHEVREAVMMILDLEAVKVRFPSLHLLALSLMWAFRLSIMKFVSRLNLQMNTANSSVARRTEKLIK